MYISSSILFSYYFVTFPYCLSLFIYVNLIILFNCFISTIIIIIIIIITIILLLLSLLLLLLLLLLLFMFIFIIIIIIIILFNLFTLKFCR